MKKDDILTQIMLEVFKTNGMLLSAGNALVNPIDLNSSRWQVLGAIALSKDGITTVPGIARMMGITRQGVQKTINLLQAEQRIVRDVNPRDARTPLYRLTDAGKATYAQAEQLHLPWVDALSQDICIDKLRNTLDVLRTLQKKIVNV